MQPNNSSSVTHLKGPIPKVQQLQAPIPIAFSATSTTSQKSSPAIANIPQKPKTQKSNPKQPRLSAPKRQKLRRVTLDIGLPRASTYIPGNGPPLAQIGLAPPHDSSAYIIERIFMPSTAVSKRDGQRMPPRIMYLIGWRDMLAARMLVPAMEIIDYVSPWEYENWQIKDAERREAEQDRDDAARLESNTNHHNIGGDGTDTAGLAGTAKSILAPDSMPEVEDVETVQALNEDKPQSRPRGVSLSTPLKRQYQDLVYPDETDGDVDIDADMEEEEEEAMKAINEHLYEGDADSNLNMSDAANSFGNAPVASRAKMEEVSLASRPSLSHPPLFRTQHFEATSVGSTKSTKSTTTITPIPLPRIPYVTTSTTANHSLVSTATPKQHSRQHSTEKSQTQTSAQTSITVPATNSNPIYPKVTPIPLPRTNSFTPLGRSSLRWQTSEEPEQQQRSSPSHSQNSVPDSHPAKKQKLNSPTMLAHVKQASLSHSTPSTSTKPPLSQNSSTKQKSRVKQPKTNLDNRPPSRQIPPQPLADDQLEDPLQQEDQDWEVLRLEAMQDLELDGRTIRYFLVRWKGNWPPDQNPSWEPEENIAPSLVRKFVERQKTKAATTAKSGKNGASPAGAAQKSSSTSTRRAGAVGTPLHRQLKQTMLSWPAARHYTSVSEAFEDVELEQDELAMDEFEGNDEFVVT